jgi:hypothetical protein
MDFEDELFYDLEDRDMAKKLADSILLEEEDDWYEEG